MTETTSSGHATGAGDTPVDDRKAWATTGLGFFGALAMTSCCILPLVLVSFGVTGVFIAQLGVLYQYRWITFALSAAFIGYGFYKACRWHLRASHEPDPHAIPSLARHRDRRRRDDLPLPCPLRSVLLKGQAHETDPTRHCSPGNTRSGSRQRRRTTHQYRRRRTHLPDLLVHGCGGHAGRSHGRDHRLHGR